MNPKRKLVKIYNPRGLIEVADESTAQGRDELAEAKLYKRYVFDRLEEIFRNPSDAIYSAHKGKRIR